MTAPNPPADPVPQSTADDGGVPPGGSDLRPATDDCVKCVTCDTACPVAEVDDEFPGPKFQGPEQWRLERDGDYAIDDSIEACSNCMRCDSACPAGVSLDRMHNTLRTKHVADRGLSRKAIRDRLLANYGTIARVASRTPRLANFLLGNPVTKWVNERLLGITADRTFPEFAHESFRTWWADRGGAQVQSADKRVAYFHGDFANYNTPAIGKALVTVFEHFGYEVAVPEQRCSGTPMFANGQLDDARRAARVNVRTFGELVEEGYDIVCSCTSCSMALRSEYPALFDLPQTASVASHTYEAVEYLREHEPLEAALSEASVSGPDLAYHAPCHARNQGLAGQAPEVLGELAGVTVTDVGDSCSGISGTYGWKSERYETSMAIGEEMFEEMAAAPAEVGLTECPTCAMQMEHGSGYRIRHPLTVIAEALVGDGE